MLAFFDLYEAWLRRQGRSHSPDTLREWADRGYCPGHARGRIDVTTPPIRPRVGAAAAVRVRAVNTSPEPWPMHPGTETGVHVRFLVFDPDWQLVQLGRAGQFEATVPPGEGVDLTLALNPPAKAGRYFVVADLMDANRCAFSQLGSQPLELSIFVENPE
jgi:hypothetical protein